MGRNLSRRQPAKNIGAHPPTRQISDENGVIRTEKLNPIPLNRKFVNPAGDVVRVSLASGFTIRSGPKQHWKDNPYGAHIWHSKLEKGFIPYASCPVRDRVPGFTPGAKDTPCEGKFDEEHCCEHVDRIIKARKAAKKKKNDDFAKQFQTNADRMVDRFGKMAEAMVSAPASKKNVLK